MRCVVYRGVGGREVVAVEDRPDPEPDRFEVVIAPPFAGINPADVLQREGKHPVPPGWPQDVPGLEVAGPVVAAGASVTAFAVGDRAFGLVGGGGLATRVIANERELAAVPDALDAASAAAAPQSFLTAFDAIVMQAGLGAGDLLLVNGASGCVGTAAVQIAGALGARVVASVRTPELRPRVAAMGAEALPADEAFARVRELGGADVILELVGGPHMSENMTSLARGGRLLIVGAKPGDEAAIVLRDLMSRRAQLIGSTLRTRPSEQKAALVQEFAHRVVPMLASGRATAAVGDVFALDDAADALDHVRTPRQVRQGAARDAGRVKLRRIDHVGVVVADLPAHVAQLEAMGLVLERVNDNSRSHALYYPCGDASVELIEVRDPVAAAERLGAAEPARIEHIAFEVDDLHEVRDLLESRGVEVSWPPFPSGSAMMIWTTAATSGGVQYQFLVRPGGEGGGA